MGHGAWGKDLQFYTPYFIHINSSADQLINKEVGYWVRGVGYEVWAWSMGHGAWSMGHGAWSMDLQFYTPYFIHINSSADQLINKEVGCGIGIHA